MLHASGRAPKEIMTPRDIMKSAARIRSSIHEVLQVDFVEWDQVDSYIDDLNQVLDEIDSLGEAAPAAALELAWRFIKRIPAVFNNVHDECELAMFCSDLAQAAWTLAKKAGNPIDDSAARLLDAYAADAHDTCRFDDVLDILAKARLSREQRRLLAAAALRAARAHPKAASELRAFANKCSQPAPGRASRSGRGRKVA